MVFGAKLIKEDVKEPVPVPFDVLVVRAIVGLAVVDQTTPLVVMEAPPSDVILPPEVAEVFESAVMAVVESEGTETVENVSFKQRIEYPFDLGLGSLSTL